MLISVVCCLYISKNVHFWPEKDETDYPSVFKDNENGTTITTLSTLDIVTTSGKQSTYDYVKILLGLR